MNDESWHDLSVTRINRVLVTAKNAITDRFEYVSLDGSPPVQCGICLTHLERSAFRCTTLVLRQPKHLCMTCWRRLTYLLTDIEIDDTLAAERAEPFTVACS